MSDIDHQIYTAIQQAEAQGRRVTRIIVSESTLQELQAQAPQQDTEIPCRPGFGIPIMVSAHLEAPFSLITEDITDLLTVMHKFIRKLNASRLAQSNERQADVERKEY